MYFIVLTADDGSMTMLSYSNGVPVGFRNKEIAKAMAKKARYTEMNGKIVSHWTIVEKQCENDGECPQDLLVH